MQDAGRRLNGRHITIMVVAVCAATVLAPTAVHAAVSSSAVHVVDPVSGSQARVNTKGGLLVTPRDASTGAEGKVDAGGHVVVGDGSGPLTVDGSVQAISADTTTLLFDGYPDGSTLSTPNIPTANYRSVRVNLDNGFSGAAPVRIFSENAGLNSSTPLDEFTIAGFGMHNTVYDVPGGAIYVYAYGGVTNIHIQVFGRR